MAEQPSVRPDRQSAFFSDGRANRPLVPGTIARGHLATDSFLHTGQWPPQTRDRLRAAAITGAAASPLSALTLAAVQGDHYVDRFPFPITEQVLRHGKNRFMIYCVACHDPLGSGEGIVVERGYTRPPSYHVDRLRKVPVGYLFSVVTQGYGSMPSYRAQIPPRDRWVIVAYVRALQLSQHFPEEALPPEMRKLAHAGGAP